MKLSPTERPVPATPIDLVFLALRDEALKTALRLADEAKARPPKTELSAKAKATAEVIADNDWGCQKRNVRLLAGAILGEEIPGSRTPGPIEVRVGMTVAVVGNSSRHSYPMGGVLLVAKADVDGDAVAIRQDTWREGNRCLPADLRLATEEETRAFFAEMPCTRVTFQALAASASQRFSGLGLEEDPDL